MSAASAGHASAPDAAPEDEEEEEGEEQEEEFEVVPGTAAALGLTLPAVFTGPLAAYLPAFKSAGFDDLDLMVGLSEDNAIQMLVLVDRELGRQIPIPEKMLLLDRLRLIRQKLGTCARRLGVRGSLNRCPCAHSR